MIFADLTSEDLKQIQKLLRKREKLQGQIQRINTRLSAFGRPSAESTLVKRGRRLQRGKGTKLKDRVVDALQSAGKEGLSVSEIADRLGTKYANIGAWFHSTGRKFKEIKKVGPARYAWRG